MNWTEQQLQAINIENSNILVSAAAGSGKTATLIQRIVRILSDANNPVKPEQLLVTTFTNAAAAELKDRVGRALRELYAQDKSNLMLLDQLNNINLAAISTLHSFCSEIISSNISLIDLDPSFSVADETITDKLLEQAVNKAYEKNLSNSEQIKTLISTFGYGRNFEVFTKLLISTLKTVKSFPDYELWLKEKAQYSDFDGNSLLDSVYGKKIKDFCIRNIELCLKSLDQVQMDVENSDEAILYEEIFSLDAQMLEGLSVLFNNNSWDDIFNSLLNIKFKSLPRKEKDSNDLNVNTVKAYRDYVKKSVENIKLQFYDNENQILSDIQFLKPHIIQFVNLLLEVDEIYFDLKSKMKVIDYSDLEHLALKCLQNGAGVYYKERFKHILIDEYQDFNYIQEEIISFIKQENNVFAVGDLKQSIYRFRNAQPEIFKSKSKLYSSNEKAGVKLDLSANFRSREQVLDYVNYVFERIMSLELGDVRYKDQERLVFGAQYYNKDNIDNKDNKDNKDNNYSNYQTEIMLLDYDKSLYAKDYPNLTNNQAEAYMIADRIQDLIDEDIMVFDKNTKSLRKLQYKDIVILLRSVNPYAKEYADVLNSCSIPAYCEQSVQVFDDKDISALYALLNIIDNPYQEVYLAEVMKSKAYMFTDNELAKLKQNNTNLYDSILAYANPDDLFTKVKNFLHAMDSIRIYQKSNTLAKSVFYAMTKSGLYYIAANQELMKRFYTLTASVQKKGIKDLAAFISFLSSKKQKQMSFIVNSLNVRNTNVVNIMSIHKSKGLEFPVVILAGCHRRFNISDIRERILIDRDMGIGSEYINIGNKTYHKHITKNAIALNIKQQNLSEEMRVLYVGLTRSKEKLIVTGIEQNKYSTFPEDASCFLDWLIPNTSNEFLHILESEQCLEIINTFTSKKVELKAAETHFDTHYLQEVMQRSGYKYPYSDETELARKFTVTELSKYRDKNYETEEFYHKYQDLKLNEPAFIKGSSRQKALERGTLIHKLMASVDFTRLTDASYVSYIKEKLQNDLLFENIVSFINSEVFNIILSSDNVYKEKVFFMPVSSSYITSLSGEEFDGNYSFLMQGVIDCLCIKDKKAVIIDYKTDRILPGQEASRANEYKTQMQVYKKAVEQILDIPVKSCIIYFFETNAHIRLI